MEGGSILKLECKHIVLESHLEKLNLYGAVGLMRALPLVDTQQKNGKAACNFLEPFFYFYIYLLFM